MMKTLKRVGLGQLCFGDVTVTPVRARYEEVVYVATRGATYVGAITKERSRSYYAVKPHGPQEICSSLADAVTALEVP